jgi:Ca2+-transporting ATPase
MHAWHAVPADRAEALLGTSLQRGLSEAEAADRLKQYGTNLLKPADRFRFFKNLAEQFNNLLVWLLVLAAILAASLSEFKDAVIFIAIIVVNAAIGLYQSLQSENTLRSLKTLVVERCAVVRQGKMVQVNASDLVPGDVVEIAEGEGVPADVRLWQSHSLALNEFVLTGESLPSEKDHLFIADAAAHTVLAERHNMAYMGTTVARGAGRGVVVATGMHTEIGKIAGQAEQVKQETSPLQKEINNLARKITLFAFSVASGLFILKLLLREDWGDALIFAISNAAAMVPEGLPSEISVALSLGAQRLARKKAIVKNLDSAETLGAASVIATDKTGTITQNQMTVRHCYLAGEEFTVSGSGYEPTGDVLAVSTGRVLNAEALLPYEPFFMLGYLAGTGKINPPDKYHNTWYPIGDPTECAFATLAMKCGQDQAQLDAAYVQRQVLPFDSYRRRMAIVRTHAGGVTAYVKGAVESILKVCTHAHSKGAIQPLTDEDHARILDLARAQAAAGLRIIALAYKDMQGIAPATGGAYAQDEVEQSLIFAGFVTMYDPPHAEVKEAICQAFEARLKVVMITGDNEITAQAIAAEIGLMMEGGHYPPVVNGEMLKTLEDEEVAKMLQKRAAIFSRVSPDDKLRIVDLLKRNGEVVAVTGDGVNDTLSLKRADIGVSMGNGSKVAQEVSKMVLLDDNFNTIVSAIRQGRTIYRNLEKTVLASICANVGELSCVLLGFVGIFAGLPIPIHPVQILMVDLVGELFPLMALAFDKPEDEIMRRPPRKPHEHMVTRRSLLEVVFAGCLIGLFSYLAFVYCYRFNVHATRHHETCLTVTYASIILCQFANILHRRTSSSVFSAYTFSNLILWLGMGISLACVLCISYLPVLNDYLHTGPLSVADWLAVAVAACACLLSIELAKRLTPNKPVVAVVAA